MWRYFPEVRSSEQDHLWSQGSLLTRSQTKGKSLEEIAAIFGDTVEYEPLNDAKVDFSGAEELHTGEKGKLAYSKGNG